MTLVEFRDQVERFKRRFGVKAFDEEFIKLVWNEVREMGSYEFMRTADVLIGTRNHTRPPSIVDFREARLKSSAGFDRQTGKLGEFRSVANCADCLDSGFIQITYRGVSGSAPCHCPRGADLIEADRRSPSPIGFRTQYGSHWSEPGEGA